MTVDTRGLIDKVLARYSGDFTGRQKSRLSIPFLIYLFNLPVFRELLQNSDDAECGNAEIHFETAAFLGLNPEAATHAGSPDLPDLKETNVQNHL